MLPPLFTGSHTQNASANAQKQETKAPDTLQSADEHPRVSSLSVVLAQEMHRLNNLLVLVRRSLEDLQRALAGVVVLSQPLEALSASVLARNVPLLWAQHAYPSQRRLAGWFSDLCARVAFFRTWLQHGPPACFWLPAFVHPQGFLTAVLQTHARTHGMPVDTLSFSHSVLSLSPQEISSSPEEGVYVSGLFLNGARWDAEAACLAESRSREMFAEMPPIHFFPQQHSQPTTNSYVCPLYKTADRHGTLSTTGQSTNFITTVEIPSAVPQEFWVLRGVALVNEPKEME